VTKKNPDAGQIVVPITEEIEGEGKERGNEKADHALDDLVLPSPLVRHLVLGKKLRLSLTQLAISLLADAAFVQHPDGFLELE
jgi:hypothetical protein